MKLGCHLSVANGFYKAGLQAVSIGANSFQFFTRNPRGGKAKALDQGDLDKLKTLMETHDFGHLLAHGSYTMNLCSNKEETRTYAKELLKDDLKRVAMIPGAIYVFHPGSHVKQGTEKGIEYIIQALNEAITEPSDVIVCLEAMSGKGTEIGRSFEELSQIIQGVKHNENLGVCIDTCHLYSAGYDIVNDLDKVLDDFNTIIGLDRLKAVHLNDSKMPFASNKDRHEKIGQGSIGLDGVIKMINHPVFRDVPFNLETPNEISGYAEEIKLLRSHLI
ncbi:deoxyribonuclease IV [Acidaminobacter sp. JC074]|uniref:deoxyribonuclease IV n=1 Tax=Acidaminobacter sp. JC074 TaxID=2530199 RepID=UPI002102AAD7|nr:deoxyribonuclease IV [Acidaminobacter sp. JC074]